MERKNIIGHPLYPSYIYGKIFHYSHKPNVVKSIENFLFSQVSEAKKEVYNAFTCYHWWDDEELLIARDGWKSHEEALTYRIEKSIFLSTVPNKSFIGVFSGVEDVIFQMRSIFYNHLEENFGIKLTDYDIKMSFGFVKKLESSDKFKVFGIRYSDGLNDYYVKQLPEKSLNVSKLIEPVVNITLLSEKMEIYSLGLYLDKDTLFLDKNANLMFPDSSLSARRVGEITNILLNLI